MKRNAVGCFHFQMLSLYFNLVHYSSFLPLSQFLWNGTVFNMFFSLSKSTTDQWNEGNPMYWTMCIGVRVFLISVFQRVKSKVTVLHPNECKRVVFHLAGESWHQIITVVAAHCSILLRILLLWWRLEMLALIHCTGSSMEHWLTVQDTETSSLVTCLLLLSLVVHHYDGSMLPSLLLLFLLP